jgi:hypothetical protein
MYRAEHGQEQIEPFSSQHVAADVRELPIRFQHLLALGQQSTRGLGSEDFGAHLRLAVASRELGPQS